MRKLIGVVILVLVFSGSVFAGDYGPVGNGGFEVGLMKLHMGGLDTALEQLGFEIDNRVLLFGGGGMGGTKLGVRTGGFGNGGELVVENAAGDQAVLGVGFGGFVYEQGIYYDGKIDIGVGGMVGGGGASLKIYNQATDSYGKEQAKGFVAIQPRVNLHYQITEVLGIEGNAGYLFTYDFHQDWTIGEETVAGPFRYFGGPRVGMRFTLGF